MTAELVGALEIGAQVAVGLIVTWRLGLRVKPLLGALDTEIQARYPGETIPEPAVFSPDVWRKEVVERTPGGKWVGRYEQLIFFFSFFADQWPIAASWLAFKLASKWNSWATTWQALAPRASDSDASRLQTIRSHLARAGQDHRLFLVGTGANIATAIVGFGAAKALTPTAALIAFLLAK